jgi:glucokinase
MTVLGVDIGKTKIAVGRVSKSGAVDGFLETATPDSRRPNAIVDTAVELATQCLTAATNDVVRAVGVCAPGVIDIVEGTVLYGGSLFPAGTNLRACFQQRFDLPVDVCNDAAAAGLAEHWWGAARGVRRAAYVTISTGLGYALTELDGTPEVVRPIGPEIAHARLFPGGATGRASLSGGGLEDAHLAATGQSRTTQQIFQTARGAIDDFSAAGGWLCAAIDALAKPDTIVLGGAIPLSQPTLVEAIRQHRDSFLGVTRYATDLRLAALRRRSGVAGAAALTYRS